MSRPHTLTRTGGGSCKIISEAFREGNGPLASSLIIITHDSEIFENSEVDQIFRFTMTADGSHVF